MRLGGCVGRYPSTVSHDVGMLARMHYPAFQETHRDGVVSDSSAVPPGDLASVV